MYGHSAVQVARNLRKVKFCGKTIRFNDINGAAKNLSQVGEELCHMVEENAALKPYIQRLGGTFNWRKIAGTNRMSAHSYGIAIDLNPELGSYWRWHKGDPATFPRNDFPRQIIEAFERHGFIWGGKWYHFDLMHFEYRPELIHKARQ